MRWTGRVITVWSPRMTDRTGASEKPKPWESVSLFLNYPTVLCVHTQREKTLERASSVFSCLLLIILTAGKNYQLTAPCHRTGTLWWRIGCLRSHPSTTHCKKCDRERHDSFRMHFLRFVLGPRQLARIYTFRKRVLISVLCSACELGWPHTQWPLPELQLEDSLKTYSIWNQFY